MFTLAIGILLAFPGLAGAHSHSLRGFPDRVTSLKFRGKEMRRAEEPAVEAIELTLANGESVVLDLNESEELRRVGVCGSKHVGTHDVIVTGCEGEDRSITIGGHGSWEFEASTATFRRLEDDEVLEGCGSLEPPEEDEDAMAMKQAKLEMRAEGEPMQAQFRGGSVDATIHYYYDRSLLQRFGNDHARTRAAVLELHAHGEVLMRHETLGIPVNLVVTREPTYVDLVIQTVSGPDNALIDFRGWLRQRGHCEETTTAFHHIITNFRQGDNVAGVAYLGTVCHHDCFNTGISEILTTAARASRVLAHELGHNLGAQHTHDPSNEGRGCRGIMSYGQAPDTWSLCSREDVLNDYAAFVRASGQTRVDTCLVPSNGAPRPTSPTPTGVAPIPRPTPPPVRRPTNPNGGGSECQVFPNRDVSSGFRHHATSGATGITTDAACNALCLAARDCTVWVRSPSRRTCWLSTQSGTVRLRSATDRVAGAPCFSGTPVLPTARPAPLPTAGPAPLPTARPAPLPTFRPVPPPTPSTPTSPLACESFGERDCTQLTRCQWVRIGGRGVCGSSVSACESFGERDCVQLTRCQWVRIGGRGVCGNVDIPPPPPVTTTAAPVTTTPRPVPTTPTAVNPRPTSVNTPCESLGARDCAGASDRCELARIGGQRLCITPCAYYGARDCASSGRCELKRIGGERVCTTSASTSGVPPAVAPPAPVSPPRPPRVAQRACGTYSDKECAASLRCGLQRVNGRRTCVDLAASSTSVATAPPAVPKRCQKTWSNDGRCGARFGGQVCTSASPFCSNSGRCQARSFGNADFDYPQGCDTVVA